MMQALEDDREARPGVYRRLFRLCRKRRRSRPASSCGRSGREAPLLPRGQVPGCPDTALRLELVPTGTDA